MHFPKANTKWEAAEASVITPFRLFKHQRNQSLPDL